MKLLFIHADFIEWKAREPLKYAEKIKERKKKVEECLVAFIAIEKGDHTLVEKASENVKEIANRVKSSKIVLYPYAHLSSNIASPERSKNVLKELRARLARDFDVWCAPFGWYKSFVLSCKGHALSELSRELRKEKVLTAWEREREIESSWYVLTPKGELIPVNEFDFSEHQGLKVFYEYETGGTRVGEEPEHVNLMRKLELVDYEPASDPGNLRWYPKGLLIKRLLEERVTELCTSYGAMEVETPVMYDYKHPALSKYLDKFPARQYVVRSNADEYFLRFAACFGQYLIASDATISYKSLPIKLYELTHYSFRREQRGELAGLRRLRTFTMPDMHTLCRDKEQAKQEFYHQFMLCSRWMSSLGLEHEMAWRFVRKFYQKNKEWVAKIVAQFGKPILVELWDAQFFYFVTKFEFNVNDTENKSSALSTVQIDLENTKRFDIPYVDEKGKNKYPVLLHTSVSGGVDRCLYALLEQQAMRIKKGEKGEFPFWLAPTQLRLVPVSDEYLKECEDLALKIPARVDIDDRKEKVSRKIRDAEREWIPMIIVYGEKERRGKVLPVRLRKGGIKVYRLENLQKEIKRQMKDYPLRKLPVPRLLTKRIVFRE